MIYSGIALFILIYFFIRNTRLDEGLVIRGMGLFMMILCFSVECTLRFFELSRWYYSFIIIAAELLIFVVYLIFYNGDIFLHQMRWFIPVFLTYAVIIHLGEDNRFLLLLTLVGLWTTLFHREKLKGYMSIIITLLTVASVGIGIGGNSNLFLIMILLLFEQYSKISDSENSKSIDAMQRKFLTHQYQEIKDVYLNMRGWRHDYHNHIQAMKAQLSFGNTKELESYLSELEKELDSVDSLVKSGNVMMDAILNSKISIMLKNDIKVDFKATLNEELSINDVDMCVMVSNLLENAIEACMKIPRKDRFIRIYSEVFGSQFYMSIQNSAEEELDFNQKNYISNKRGNHGLGMKRVQFLVSKYNGYLNLQNEPGIFASEITIPL